MSIATNANTTSHQLTTLYGNASHSSGLVHLPPDVLIKILGMLSVKELGSLNQTCSQLFHNTRNNSLIFLFSDYFPNSQKTDPNQTDLEALKEQYFINSNQTRGVYTSFNLEELNSTVYSLALGGKRLFSGTIENTIKIWDLNANTCIATLQGHDKPVRCLAIDGQRLFSGSFDRTIKIWDLNTHACTATLEGHHGSVRSLALNGQRLYSGCDQGSIEIWDLNTNTCTGILEGHKGSVYSLALDKERLYSGSLDNTIKIWDLNTNTRTATLQGKNGPVCSLALEGQRLCSGYVNRTIEIWDLNTNTRTAILEGHKGSVLSLALKGERLFSGSHDKTIKIWDLNTNTCTATLQGNNSIVYSVLLDGQRLFCGSNTIKIWNFNASDEAVFNEVANLLKSEDHSIASDAMNRFNRMPAKAKNAIYRELYQIMAPFANDYPGCAEHAFHNQNGQSSTPEQKAQAILNYLAKRS
ncbi:MAG: F-box/WD repeat-containing protein [Verrucomicrobia bacterium]|nr:F-box/WD repeat-containing protein [Verrucomicrobiota bacterium]